MKQKSILSKVIPHTTVNPSLNYENISKSLPHLMKSRSDLLLPQNSPSTSTLTSNSKLLNNETLFSNPGTSNQLELTEMTSEMTNTKECSTSSNTGNNSITDTLPTVTNKKNFEPEISYCGNSETLQTKQSGELSPIISNSQDIQAPLNNNILEAEDMTSATMSTKGLDAVVSTIQGKSKLWE